MGSSVSAYYDDANHYMWLCELYDEVPVNNAYGTADPYCKHANEMEAMHKECTWISKEALENDQK